MIERKRDGGHGRRRQGQERRLEIAMQPETSHDEDKAESQNIQVPAYLRQVRSPQAKESQQQGKGRRPVPKRDRQAMTGRKVFGGGNVRYGIAGQRRAVGGRADENMGRAQATQAHMQRNRQVRMAEEGSRESSCAWGHETTLGEPSVEPDAYVARRDRCLLVRAAP